MKAIKKGRKKLRKKQNRKILRIDGDHDIMSSDYKCKTPDGKILTIPGIIPEVVEEKKIVISLTDQNSNSFTTSQPNFTSITSDFTSGEVEEDKKIVVNNTLNITSSTNQISSNNPIVNLPNYIITFDESHIVNRFMQAYLPIIMPWNFIERTSDPNLLTCHCIYLYDPVDKLYYFVSRMNEESTLECIKKTNRLRDKGKLLWVDSDHGIYDYNIISSYKKLLRSPLLEGILPLNNLDTFSKLFLFKLAGITGIYCPCCMNMSPRWYTAALTIDYVKEDECNKMLAPRIAQGPADIVTSYLFLGFAETFHLYFCGNECMKSFSHDTGLWHHNAMFYVGEGHRLYNMRVKRNNIYYSNDEFIATCTKRIEEFDL